MWSVDVADLGMGFFPSGHCGRLSGEVPSVAVRRYVSASVAHNTKRAYAADLRHFRRWGGSIPASEVLVANYLAEHALILSPATLARRLAAISKAHEACGLPNPVRSELVRATLRGIRRQRQIHPRQARPILAEQLIAMVTAMGNSPREVRDKALLLIGFAGGFRRSELIAVNCTDLDFRSEGVVIHIRHSKTDQEGDGRAIGIPQLASVCCPVSALNRWREIGGLQRGPVFRRIGRHGQPLSTRLSGEAVSRMVKERVAAIGEDPTPYSGHSLRAGLATSAAAAQLPAWRIRQQTGHASDAMLARYIRDQDLFSGNLLDRLF
jgi:integrase